MTTPKMPPMRHKGRFKTIKEAEEDMLREFNRQMKPEIKMGPPKRLEEKPVPRMKRMNKIQSARERNSKT